MTALLTVLAAATGARAVVEVGTNSGATAIALRDGMVSGGVLTSIDPDPGAQRTAKESLSASPSETQVRLITGDAGEVLPRLADGAYDLIVVNLAGSGVPDFAAQARRLLRPGGALVLGDATAGGTTLDPAERGSVTQASRAAIADVRDDEGFSSVILPVADGILIAVKR